MIAVPMSEDPEVYGPPNPSAVAQEYRRLRDLIGPDHPAPAGTGSGR